jgi:putative phosphoribosyl transferase
MTDPAESVTISVAPDIALAGLVSVPDDARGCVVFAHGSGSGRLSPRNQQVADGLHRVGLATLLFDLLTEPEDDTDRRTAEFRFDIDLLASRLHGVTAWARTYPSLRGLRIGYFGASTGAAAALQAAADANADDVVEAIVSRGGRPDLAGPHLQHVRAPTLLIVGSLDTEVLALNRQAAQHLSALHQIEIGAGASHLFEEPGTLDEVVRLAAWWFVEHLIERGTPS